jgi:hypothetical protein
MHQTSFFTAGNKDRENYEQSTDFPRETSSPAVSLHMQSLRELSPPPPRGRWNSLPARSPALYRISPPTTTTPTGLLTLPRLLLSLMPNFFTRLVSPRSALSPAFPRRSPANNSLLEDTLTQNHRLTSSRHQQPHPLAQTCVSPGNTTCPNFSPGGVRYGQCATPLPNSTPHIHSP